MLKHRSFNQKIVMMMVSAVVGVVIVAGLSVWQTRNEIVEGKRASLRTAVESARSVVLGFQARAAAGTLTVAEAKQAAREALRPVRYGAGSAGYFYIFTLESEGVLHPFKTEWEGKRLVGVVRDGNGIDMLKADADGLRASKDGSVYVDTMYPRPGNAEPVSKLQYVALVPGWDWMVGSGLYMDDVAQHVRAAMVQQGLIGLAVLLVIGTVCAMVRRSVVAQLGGDPQTAIDAMDEVATGNLGIDLGAPPQGSLLHGLERMVASMRTTLLEVRSSTDSIGTASAEIATGNQDLSSRTEQTASNLQQAASSMEELSVTVRQSAASAHEANTLAGSAADVAARGGAVVSQVVATMDDINTSSKKIADIIGVIDGIAFQTNILALNAAVEAARAGEQGRGFAVVAAEVRALAQRSAGAAKEIKGLIGASVDKVEAGSRLVADAGQTMSEIVGSVKRVSDMIADITGAANEQSQGIGALTGSVTVLDQMTQQNAALVEQSAAAAESLREQAARLATVVGTFRLGSA